MQHPSSATHTNRLPAACAADERLDAPPEDETPACGWFESSWALRQGLAVSELADCDGTVAALWFVELGPVNGRSMRLQ